jgi:glycosyltransferase involved in cell wall biosynthesis
MPSKLVSVIIPTYNRADFLKYCLTSVVHQTYRPIEIIVIDDGSSDHTGVVISEVQSQILDDPNLVLKFIRVVNGGAPRARNIGVLESKGEWIQFLDSDDIILPKKIENAVELANSQDADIVYSRSQFIDENQTKIDKFWGRPLDGSDNDYFEFSWQTMCPLYSRQALDNIGLWNEALTMQQDWEFCIRGVVSGLKIHFLNQVDSLYRVHSQGNIGMQLSTEKNRSRETALWSIYDLLDKKDLLSPYLRKRFTSRLLHILLSYYELSDAQAASEILTKMHNQKLLAQWQFLSLKSLPMTIVSKAILRGYDFWKTRSRPIVSQ